MKGGACLSSILGLGARVAGRRSASSGTQEHTQKEFEVGRSGSQPGIKLDPWKMFLNVGHLWKEFSVSICSQTSEI